MWKRKGEQGTSQHHAMILILKENLKKNPKIPQKKTPTHTTVTRFLNKHMKNIHSRRIVPTYLFTWKKFTTQTPVTHKTAVCASDRLIYCFPLLRAGLDSVKASALRLSCWETNKSSRFQASPINIQKQFSQAWRQKKKNRK